MGLFVMAEVYHSRRLCCAASHELMMTGRRERWREEEEKERERKGAAEQRQREMDRKEKRSPRLVRDIRGGSF